MDQITKSTNELAARHNFNVTLYNLIHDIKDRAEKQFKYNLETNVPNNIIKIEDSAQMAVNQGVIGATRKQRRSLILLTGNKIKNVVSNPA